MIEFELPEPQFEDLTLVNIDAVRGNGPAGAEPLKGRVAVGGPHGFKITAAEAAADPELSKFIDKNAGHYEYYFVHLAISFSALGSPKLRSAEVKLTLTSVPDTPEPFALSLDPLADGYQLKVDSKARILPSLKVAEQVELSLGDYERGVSYDRSERSVRGLGLDGPNPGWEFTRTPAGELEGSHRLTMVVQAGYGAAVSVSGIVRAKAEGNFPWRFARDLPRPWTFDRVV